ncbi:MAG: hypothetical protein KJ643_15200 [Gammaproteobacteria bacterium]|uniref:hypothetical protein n=1 Tax=Pseudomonas mandelii TaxID=75612 RepID=UPI0012B1B60C|nr:hypothetical protein [Pseudomonas mandelii]MBU0523579.1 hypothetical protein [Gammaproteobacteria bacterium]MBU0844615.1 hypothetical protein [Gammaproteobacteria bacterium]MBU1843668.1 hypothetical protein [Gammaproteobacteria bacterium]MSU92828.1 hypothetical protein [Pseudomonas mandelii]
MLEATTRILMQKYDPSNPLLQWVNPPQTDEPTDARAPLSKSVKTDNGKKSITLVMSSADYTDKQITGAITAYNREHPEHMSHSFQLPVTMYGFPVNSWVLVLPERE